MGEHVGAESGDPIVGQLEVGNGTPLLKRPGVSALTLFFLILLFEATYKPVFSDKYPTVEASNLQNFAPF